jgi:hypothetical protein
MKQTRLLEIIREEIAGALREGEAEESTYSCEGLLNSKLLMQNKKH